MFFPKKKVSNSVEKQRQTKPNVVSKQNQLNPPFYPKRCCTTSFYFRNKLYLDFIVFCRKFIVFWYKNDAFVTWIQVI